MPSGRHLDGAEIRPVGPTSARTASLACTGRECRGAAITTNGETRRAVLFRHRRQAVPVERPGLPYGRPSTTSAETRYGLSYFGADGPSPACTGRECRSEADLRRARKSDQPVLLASTAKLCLLNGGYAGWTAVHDERGNRGPRVLLRVRRQAPAQDHCQFAIGKRVGMSYSRR